MMKLRQRVRAKHDPQHETNAYKIKNKKMKKQKQRSVTMKGVTVMISGGSDDKKKKINVIREKVYLGDGGACMRHINIILIYQEVGGHVETYEFIGTMAYCCWSVRSFLKVYDEAQAPALITRMCFCQFS